jgi:hypothetical protein
VSTRFEQLEDAPGALSESQQADFVVIISLGSVEPPRDMSKEGR